MGRRKFTAEYKREAAQLVVEQGVSIRQAAVDLGIGKSTLEKWIREYRQSGNGSGQLSESEREELKRLRKENRTLRMERDILKKATAYFAKTTP